MTFTDCLPTGAKTRAPEKQDVFIALPVYSALYVEFTGSLLNALRTINARLEFHAGDSLVTRARNNVVHNFLQTDIPWLLFLDTDLVFPVEHLQRLLSWSTEYPIIGGCYPKKKLGPPEWVVNALPGVECRPDGLQEVAEVGTGMMRIHRSVFGALREAFPQLRYRCDGNRDIRYDFFPVGTWKSANAKPEDDARYLSEDWFICEMARSIGYRVYADTKVTAQHIGLAAYPLDPKKPAESQKATEVVSESATNAPTMVNTAISPAANTYAPPKLEMALKPKPQRSRKRNKTG